MDELNAINDEVSKGQSPREAKQRGRAARDAFVTAISELTDDEWAIAVGPDAAITRGDMLGGITSGPGGAFDHVAAHLEDLADYVWKARSSKKKK